MKFWIGYPATGNRQMLFATEGGRPKEVPHAVIHTTHGGLFTRTNHSAYFACDRCGATLRLRVEDGCDPSEAEIVEALTDLRPEEVVSSAALHRNQHDEAADRRASDSYRRGEERNQAAQRRRALDALAEIEATPGGDDGEELTEFETVAEA